ncbi:hypothetical protein [Aquimarina longa]|uniref:hypothetical protein n=1 Tax=Aquimarina longa TaxID=1080221 RepID=UPI000780DEEC|nr:hypothetical protein [Aquimarina longa]
MIKLDTKHKKKSFVLTVLVHVGIIFLLFYLSLNYIIPEEESGIAINFGTTATGSGKIQPNKAIKSSPKQTTLESSSSVPESPKASPEIIEKVVTQESEDAPVIDKKPKKKLQKKIEQPKEKVKSTDQKALEKTDKKTPVKKKVEKKPEDPKPDKSTLDILNSFSNGSKSDGKAKGGEGDDSVSGDKGNPDGDLNAKSYYGTGKGLDGDGNYRLGGRKALNKKSLIPDCNETGIVVVKIEVNQSGKVIRATPGVKGTTNNASCLMEPAKKAAEATRFNSDPKAPIKQVGTIIYQFKLSE